MLLKIAYDVWSNPLKKLNDKLNDIESAVHDIQRTLIMHTSNHEHAAENIARLDHDIANARENITSILLNKRSKKDG